MAREDPMGASNATFVDESVFPYKKGTWEMSDMHTLVAQEPLLFPNVGDKMLYEDLVLKLFTAVLLAI